MLYHYLKLAVRNALKNKSYTLLNITGLALGMGAFLSILSYVYQEYSYDRMHKDGERIYRVESLFYKGEQKTDHWATSTNGYAPAMKATFPEIEDYTRINFNNSTRIVRYKDVKYREKHVCFADANFFTFFSYQVVAGDPATFLKAPNWVVISETAAKKYFGQENPIGKQLEISTISSTLLCQVTGVFRDLSSQSTMQFDLLLSWETSSPRLRNYWYQHGSYTFLKLQPNTSVESLEKRFPALAEGYKTEPALKDLRWEIDLVALEDIHLNPAKPKEIEKKGNRHSVEFLLLMAFASLLIAFINYTNLSVSRAMDRAKEIGIRKTLGSEKRALILLFLSESLPINVVAVILALLLNIGAGFLSDYAGLAFSFSIWRLPYLYLVLPALLIAGTLLSGLYPSIVLSRVEPIAALRGKYMFSKSGLYLRKGLVLLQFAASLVLIVGTYIVYRQLSFMMSENLRVSIDQTMVLQAPAHTADYYQKTENFKADLKSLTHIGQVTGSGAVPGQEVGKYLANRRLHSEREEDRLYEMLFVDEDFIPAYRLQLIAGRNFDAGRPADQYGLILNETALKQFGFESSTEAIGEKVWLEANPGRANEIIGVVKDYHQQSLQEPYRPTILFMDPDYRWIPKNYYSLKITTADIAPLVAQVEKVWNRHFPQSSFDFFFLDDYFNQQYAQDTRLWKIFLAFACLAIFIACLGLLGLTSYNVARRTKEIGIRKVLGANAGQVWLLINKDILKLLLLSGIVSIPPSIYIMRAWLQNYAFRMSLHWSYFLLPLLVLTFIALATVSYFSFKAAVINPAKSLRNE